MKLHGLFKLIAKNTMNEIMETYLPLIYSNSIEFDPLINVDYTETFNRSIEGENETSGENSINSSNNGSSNSSSTSNSSSLNISSDTPQGQISKQAILNGDYASLVNASDTTSSIGDTTETENISESNSQSSSNSSSNSSEEYTKRIKGNSGVSATAQALIKQYRDIIRGFDKEIIEELNCLFMCIY